MDPDRRRALSEFYREEFLRHIQFLEASGVLDGADRGTIGKAYDRLLTDLDRICWRADFPALAETLLQNFEALTRLSELDPRRGH